MLHLLVIGVNRRTRNTYTLIKKGVRGTGFHLADETTWLKKKKIKVSKLATVKEGLGVLWHILINLLCCFGGKLFL